jgi:hypothetical protein
MRLSYESQVRVSTTRRMSRHRISINWRSGLKKKNSLLSLQLGYVHWGDVRDSNASRFAVSYLYILEKDGKVV